VTRFGNRVFLKSSVNLPTRTEEKQLYLDNSVSETAAPGCREPDFPKSGILFEIVKLKTVFFATWASHNPGD
jgi:hypothetical protein